MNKCLRVIRTFKTALILNECQFKVGYILTRIKSITSVWLISFQFTGPALHLISSQQILIEVGGNTESHKHEL